MDYNKILKSNEILLVKYFTGNIKQKEKSLRLLSLKLKALK